MAGLKMTLKRVFNKGHICFELPREPELLEATRGLLAICHDKKSDFVNVTLDVPHKPRSTGKGSQNHHLNGHIMQICQRTGHGYEAIKYCVKMTAVEQLGYPYTELNGHILPKGESDCDTAECAKLIEAAHYLAASLGIVLREEDSE